MQKVITSATSSRVIIRKMFSAKVALKFQDSMTGVTGGLPLLLAYKNERNAPNVNNLSTFLCHCKSFVTEVIRSLQYSIYGIYQASISAMIFLNLPSNAG